MAGFALDTSCIVAASCDWHDHHEDAVREIDGRLRVGEPMVMAAPALVEAYAVLTRLPARYRLPPADALALLDRAFIEKARVVVLDAAGYLALLRQAPAAGVSGGRTYDAVIAACVMRARASVLLTFNPADFPGLGDQGVEVIVPGARRP